MPHHMYNKKDFAKLQNTYEEAHIEEIVEGYYSSSKEEYTFDNAVEALYEGLESNLFQLFESEGVSQLTEDDFDLSCYEDFEIVTLFGVSYKIPLATMYILRENKVADTWISMMVNYVHSMQALVDFQKLKGIPFEIEEIEAEKAENLSNMNRIKSDPNYGKRDTESAVWYYTDQNAGLDLKLQRRKNEKDTLIKKLSAISLSLVDPYLQQLEK